MSTAVKRPDKVELREAIFNLEDYLKTLPQADLTWVHRFTPGLYARKCRCLPVLWSQGPFIRRSTYPYSLRAVC